MKLALAIAISTPGWVVMVLDVSRAHFHSAVARKLTIQLPAKDYEPGKVGLLPKCIYGTRDAANRWERYYVDALDHAD